MGHQLNFYLEIISQNSNQQKRKRNFSRCSVFGKISKSINFPIFQIVLFHLLGEDSERGLLLVRSPLFRISPAVPPPGPAPSIIWTERPTVQLEPRLPSSSQKCACMTYFVSLGVIYEKVSKINVTKHEKKKKKKKRGNNAEFFFFFFFFFFFSPGPS